MGGASQAGVACAGCGTLDDRGDSQFCRKCGLRLFRGVRPTAFDDAAVPARPSKTVPDEPTPAAMSGAAAHVEPPVVASEGVARLLAIRVGPPPALGVLYAVLRGCVALALSLVAAATLGWVRQTHGIALARELSTPPNSRLFDVGFCLALLAMTVLIGFVVNSVTNRRWRRL